MIFYCAVGNYDSKKFAKWLRFFPICIQSFLAYKTLILMFINESYDTQGKYKIRSTVLTICNCLYFFL